MTELNNTDQNCTIPEGVTVEIYNATKCWWENSTSLYTGEIITTSFKCCSNSSDEDGKNFNMAMYEHLINLAVFHIMMSVVCTVVVGITLLILSRFKHSQTNRILIHKNLLAAIFMFAIFGASLLLPVYMKVMFNINMTVDWLRCAMSSARNFSLASIFSWMLMEGVYLHIVVIKPFRGANVPPLFFYLFGWGLPTVCVLCWSIVQITKNIDCNKWMGSYIETFILIYCPIMFILLVNLIIILNLLRIVVIKLCRDNMSECRRIWQTIKATLVLTFLLGAVNVTQLVPYLEFVLRSIVFQLILYLQIIFICVYILSSSKVHKSIKRWWTRYRDSRLMSSAMASRIPLAKASQATPTFTSTHQGETSVLEKFSGTELVAIHAPYT